MTLSSDDVSWEEGAGRAVLVKLLPGTEIMRDFGGIHLPHDKTDHV